jgi:hypothetical protein
MSPDEHAGYGSAAVLRVAPRLEHDVISTGPRRDRVALASRRQPMSPCPGPWIAALVEHDGTHFGSAIRHQLSQRLQR